MCAAALAAAAFLVVPGGASACESPCTEPPSFVVARGHSLYGVPWQIEATRFSATATGPGGVETHFSISPRGGYTGVGYYTGLPLPLPRRFVFTANAGSDIDRHPESDLSGITRRRVAKLVVKMSDGERLTVYPKPAPRRLRKRLPWLRGLRFFDVFFPADQEPKLVTALNRTGHVLARHKNHRGLL